jgi:isopenicillin-N epimerase
MSKLLPGGWAEVRRRNNRLLREARQLLCNRLGVEPPCPEDMLGSLSTIPLPERFQNRPKSGKIEEEQLRLYDEFGIEVPFVRMGGPEGRYFRVSAHVYNHLAEYEYLAEALDALTMR